jgi:hypothetical protein
MDRSKYLLECHLIFREVLYLLAQCLLEQNNIEFFKFLEKCTDEMLLHDQK